MILSKLNPQAQQTTVVNTFGGYNHNIRCATGEFYDENNMSTNLFPALTVHESGGKVNPTGTDLKYSAIKALADKIYAVTETDLYEWDVEHTATLVKADWLPSASADVLHERYLVSLGAYLIAMPDKRYINLSDNSDFGNMEKIIETATFRTYVTGAFFHVALEDGTDVNTITFSPNAPASPSDGQYWGDTSNADNVTLQKWNAAAGMWIAQIACIKITGAGLTHKTINNNPSSGFEEGDVVHIGNIDTTDHMLSIMDGYYKILKAYQDENDGRTDYILVQGMMSSVSVSITSADALNSIDISVKLPNVQFMFECNNRLWGCYYGPDENGEKILNEIYASSLGSFRNWHEYLGLSTDSYTASVGSPGKFTGACLYNGYMLFFKENCMHKVYGSLPSDFTITMTTLDGVQDGCDKSLAQYNGFLYYKSRNGVCRFDGSMPTVISSQFGTEKYNEVEHVTVNNRDFIKGAVAAVVNGKYYINLKDTGGWHIFSYDTTRGIWHREDGFYVKQIESSKEDLFGVYDNDTSGLSYIYSYLGTHMSTHEVEDWYCETGFIDATYADRTYVSRTSIRMQMDTGSRMIIYIEYDSGEWEHVATIESIGTKSFSLPIRPKRCDHYRLRFEGRGKSTIYGYTNFIQKGSVI